MFFIPCDFFGQAFTKLGFGFESEFLGCSGGVEHSAGLSVGFAAVPGDVAFESGDFDDEFDTVFDGDLESGSQVDRLAFSIFTVLPSGAPLWQRG